MRPAYPLTLLLFLLACDSSSSDADALVGTWRLDTLTETVRVTSRTTQAAPDLSATPIASVRASGARTATFDVVVNLTGAGGFAQLLLATDEKPQTGAEVSVIQIPGSAQAILTDFDTGEQFYAFFGDGIVVARSGGRFTIPTLALNGNGAVTIAGTVVYPEITLMPGQPTEVKPYEVPLDGTLVITFEAGGTFSARANGPGSSAAATGTWKRVDAQSIRLTSSSTDLIESGVFEVTTDDGALVLTVADLNRDGPCGTACIREIESEVFVQPGSLSGVSFVSRFRFRAGS